LYNTSFAQKQLYEFDNNGLSSRWASPENSNGKKGGAGNENNGAKGHGWVNFYRIDDVSATAYFYLDSPVDNLPVLQPLHVRTYNLKSK